MARLDRERTPALFTVATSVMSGLVLAILTKALQAGISAGATLLFSALFSLGVPAACWTAFATKGQFRKRPHTAFLMTSAFDQKYYLAALVQRVHSALDRDDIEMVLKVPDRDYDASAQSHHLRRILSKKQNYIGGLIIAGDVPRLREDLTTFCRDSRLPVVFTDVEPFHAESEYPDRSAFIGYDTGEIGDLAGQWLATRLRGRSRPHVLVIASREHRDRQQRCEETLRSALTGVEIIIDDRCDFVRSRAYGSVRAHIRQLDPGRRLDAIFCTNDEMALGAVDALSASSSAAIGATLVVGVDGVLEAKALIDTGDSPLRATVVQDTHRLAVGAVDLLAKMHRGHTVPKRTILNAELYEAG